MSVILMSNCNLELHIAKNIVVTDYFFCSAFEIGYMIIFTRTSF